MNKTVKAVAIGALILSLPLTTQANTYPDDFTTNPSTSIISRMQRIINAQLRVSHTLDIPYIVNQPQEDDVQVLDTTTDFEEVPGETKQQTESKSNSSKEEPKQQETKPLPPAQEPIQSGPKEITYTVKAGDQLGLIAYNFNTTVSEIMRLNNLSNPDQLSAGQQLTIKGEPRKIPDPYTNTTKGGSAVAAHWDFVNVHFPIGTRARVTDIATGLSYEVVRFSGFLHADVEPVTAADTATMHEIYNNRWSWASRPVVVEVNGHRFAASINGMPHDIQTNNNNNFPGHSCIHFLGSKNHFNQQLDSNHQANIQRAVGK